MSQRSGGGSVSANFAQTWRLSSTPQHDSIRSFKFHPDAGNYRDRRARQEWLQLPFWADSVFKISEIQKNSSFSLIFKQQIDLLLESMATSFFEISESVEGARQPGAYQRTVAWEREELSGRILG